MKVLIVNSVCGVGSTGRIVVDLHNILVEHGHECLIAYGRGIADPNINTYKIGSDFDLYNHLLKTRILDKHGLGSKQSTIKLIDKIKEFMPDIIHLHNIHGYYLNYEILFEFLKNSNIRVVWTLHDCWAITGHCAYFDYVNCFKWKDMCHSCPQQKTYPASYLLDNSSVNFNKKKKCFSNIPNLTLVVPSQWLANIVKESFLNNYPIKIINNGIDLNEFYQRESNYREKLKLQQKIILLGVASIWEKRKGLEIFIELSKILDDNYQIILVGVTESQQRNIPKNIITISKTNSLKELSELYTIADIFINPTMEDNFPTTNLESLACGTPVITFDTGGSVESIDSDTGIVVKKNNIKSLKRACEEIINDNNKYTSYLCAKRAKCHYDKKNNFLKYLDIYGEDL